jgi:hypothetical protein
MTELIEENIQRGLLRKSMRMATGISIAQVILGIGAAILAIIGLANVFPVMLVAIATIIVGGNLIFETGAIAGRYSSIASGSQARAWMVAEFFSGTAGITLGILALLHLVPMILVPIAAMVLGVALVLDSIVNAWLNALELAKSETEGSDHGMARKTVIYSAGIQGVVGILASALGLIALLGVNPVTLSLVAILSIGFANLVNGEASSHVLSVLLQGEPAEEER